MIELFDWTDRQGIRLFFNSVANVYKSCIMYTVMDTRKACTSRKPKDWTNPALDFLSNNKIW